MASPARRWTAAAAMLLGLWAGLAQAVEAPRDPYSYFFHDTFGDFPEELELAREQGKKGILFFFEMDECPFCHRMKDTVLNQPLVQDWFRERFLIFSVDVEGDTEVVDFKGNTMAAKDFAFRVNRVRATPVFLFVNLEGESVTGSGILDGELPMELLPGGARITDGRFVARPPGGVLRYPDAGKAAEALGQQAEADHHPDGGHPAGVPLVDSGPELKEREHVCAMRGDARSQGHRILVSW